MIESNQLAVASYGEALCDCIPEGLFLGGAPFNAAYHLACLGVESYPITCIGDDLLGDQILERAKSAGLNTEFIKRHEILETGVALAKLDDQGNAEYDIRLPSAWDEIELSDDEMSSLNRMDAMIYGSLVTRSELSRDTLEGLLESFTGLKVCDIKLPRTGLEVKFSYVWLAGMALRGDGTGDDRAYTDALAKDAALVDFAKRVEIVGDDGVTDLQAEGLLRLKDGTEIALSYDLADPMPEEVLAGRLRRKAEAMLGGEGANLWEFADGLDHVTARTIGTRLASSPSELVIATG